MKSNREIELARDFITHTNANIFLTGRAGTGKTTFLHEVVKSVKKRVVVAAPTGIAALNAGGVTLHSFFMLPLTPYLKNSEHFEAGRRKFQRLSKVKKELIRSIELLVIDEISMVRADTLDGVDDILRRERDSNKPFGGVQLLLIGDVQQLAPVCKEEDWEMMRHEYNSPYFFDSKAFRGCKFSTIELQEIFRQSDNHFTSMLNAIRDNMVTNDIATAINSRYNPDFEQGVDSGYVTLTTHVYKATKINQEMLAMIDEPIKYYEASISGEFPENSYPNDTVLKLKLGAQVMFIKNGTSDGVNYYNGMMAIVTEIGHDYVMVLPKDAEEEMSVRAIDWENKEYVLDKESGEVKETIKGVFSQLPLKCAWAITIHKSQGLTFDKAIIDVGRAFAHGQAYVAFSRCRSLDGMVLKSPFTSMSIIRNEQVEQFGHFVSQNHTNEDEVELYKREYFRDMLCDIFSFDNMAKYTRKLYAITRDKLSTTYPQFLENMKIALEVVHGDIGEVSGKFHNQIDNIIRRSEDYRHDNYLVERVVKASKYFSDKLSPLSTVAAELKHITSDSKEVNKRLTQLKSDFLGEYRVKSDFLDMCSVEKPVDIEQYRRIKIGDITTSTSKDKKRGSASKGIDIKHQELYDMLCEWRREVGEGSTLFKVLPNKALVQISTLLPLTKRELAMVSGVGKQKIINYGDDIIDIVTQYCEKKEIVVACERKELSIDFSDKDSPIKSQVISYNMYHEGLSVEDISLQRKLSITTIYGHLVQCIESGMLSAEEFITKDKIEHIARYMEHFDGSLTSLKLVLGDDFSYNDIRIALTVLSPREDDEL